MSLAAITGEHEGKRDEPSILRPYFLTLSSISLLHNAGLAMIADSRGEIFGRVDAALETKFACDELLA